MLDDTPIVGAGFCLAPRRVSWRDAELFHPAAGPVKEETVIWNVAERISVSGLEGTLANIRLFEPNHSYVEAWQIA